MGLSFLEISEFRNLASVRLSPVAEGVNFIYGKNGSGKTSLLEAIYYLSLARSFRGSQANRVVRHSADKLSIFGHVSAFPSQILLGLERHKDGKARFRINGEEIYSVAELASLLPVQLMNSNCHTLLDSSPAFRRKYLDFGLFYQVNDFLRAWRHYGHVLKQRNAALRNRAQKKELDIWTYELINSAIYLDQLRCDYVEKLAPFLIKSVAELLPVFNLKITYHKGWDTTNTYAEILLKMIDRDYQLGYTQYGPHKADLKITINEIPAKDILSRGQQKLFVCAMMLARGALLQNHMNKAPIYLIDDLPSELDMASCSKLTGLLSKQKAQVFVTAIENTMRDSFLTNVPVKMFHVEHGHVGEMNASETE
jgi:DNA replication and repair protein RecF